MAYHADNLMEMQGFIQSLAWACSVMKYFLRLQQWSDKSYG